MRPLPAEWHHVPLVTTEMTLALAIWIPSSLAWRRTVCLFLGTAKTGVWLGCRRSLSGVAWARDNRIFCDTLTSCIIAMRGMRSKVCSGPTLPLAVAAAQSKQRCWVTLGLLVSTLVRQCRLARCATGADRSRGDAPAVLSGGNTRKAEWNVIISWTCRPIQLANWQPQQPILERPGVANLAAADLDSCPVGTSLTEKWVSRPGLRGAALVQRPMRQAGPAASANELRLDRDAGVWKLPGAVLRCVCRPGAGRAHLLSLINRPPWLSISWLPPFSSKDPSTWPPSTYDHRVATCLTHSTTQFDEGSFQSADHIAWRHSTLVETTRFEPGSRERQLQRQPARTGTRHPRQWQILAPAPRWPWRRRRPRCRPGQ